MNAAGVPPWMLLLGFLMGNGAGAGSPETELETSVCGPVREPLAFWFFRRAAGCPDARRLTGMAGVEALGFQTLDGRRLGGYRLRAERPRGYLLVAQGNAMLADRILTELAFFRELALDVYVYDYRGYGLSGGRSRLRAIVSDYREIVQMLNGRGYPRRYLYGLSMGGIVLLNAVGRSEDYDALVVDSSPARISVYGCPEGYDPVRHVPEDASRLMLVMGLKDRVVAPGEVRPLAETIRMHGGRVLVDPVFSHPLQDPDPGVRARRLHRVAEFLLAK